MESSHTKNTLSQTTESSYPFLTRLLHILIRLLYYFCNLKKQNKITHKLHSALKSLSWGTFLPLIFSLLSRAHMQTPPPRPTLHLHAGVFVTLCCTLTPHYVCLIGIWVESRLRAQQSCCVSPQICFFFFFFFFSLTPSSSLVVLWGIVGGRGRSVGRAQWRGGRVDVDFSSLLCESQGMVTINILYSLKPSKNTILEGGGVCAFTSSSLLLGVYKQAVLCLVPLIFTYL